MANGLIALVRQRLIPANHPVMSSKATIAAWEDCIPDLSRDYAVENNFNRGWTPMDTDQTSGAIQKSASPNRLAAAAQQSTCFFNAIRVNLCPSVV
jgi:hypothetical protein